ncbi:ADP-ribosylglycohydrolase family protein [Methanobrevibacter sp.]|uniref:ADP-ribosylglycohydrolase family protein n=1 Tax=Methanobrevibacter sp. TaxID=66852 RepID=UPI0038655CAC
MKVKDGIIGFVVGDALGVPVEFHSRNELRMEPVVDMREYGTYNQPKGTWSDDSSMTIATMTSIINKKGIDYTDIMDEFIKWMDNAEHTPHDEVFDIGSTTSRGLNRYKEGCDALKSGGTSTHDNGNGSLMRVLPLAYIEGIDYETIENVSALTHGHERSKIACVLYVEIAKSMLSNEGLSIAEHIENSNEKIMDYYKDCEELDYFYRIFENDYSEGIRSGGYVIDTLETVTYCLKNTDNYKDAVLKAVNFGGDTDTNAAICGGLAGIYYGYDSIPVDWINEIVKIDELLALCEKYEAFCDESQQNH